MAKIFRSRALPFFSSQAAFYIVAIPETIVFKINFRSSRYWFHYTLHRHRPSMGNTCAFFTISVDTERQKKLITSSERHSLKSKALKWIIIGHRLAIVLLTKHISKIKRVIESKESKIIGEIARGSFFNNHRNYSPPGQRIYFSQTVLLWRVY